MIVFSECQVTERILMSMPITSNSPAQEASVSRTTRGNTSEPVTTREEAKPQQNAAIVSASFEVAISSKNESLALMLKSAINGINDVLRPQFGDNAIENLLGQDNSSEGTASRIVSLSTGFYEAFKLQHPGEDEADVFNQFMTTIRSGFEKGYREAVDILQGLGVFGGDLATSIGKTYELVLKGYGDFEAAHNGSAVSGKDSPEV